MIHIAIHAFLLFCSIPTVFGQENPSIDPDASTKEVLYNKYKKEVRSYTKNDFDELFISFFENQNGQKILTKEEFYTFTIKIAIYSEKLGLLYKDQKEESERAKKEWFSRSYQDYLNSKKQ